MFKKIEKHMGKAVDKDLSELLLGTFMVFITYFCDGWWTSYEFLIRKKC